MLYVKILAILAAVILYNCLDYIPDSVKDWWKNSTLRKWVYPTFSVILTVAVALGIHFDVLVWGTVVIPVLFGLPYILGMVMGIWNNMKNAGLKATSKNAKDAKEIAERCLKELGCQPKIHKDGTLSVSYQGENFLLEFDGLYACVWNPMWSCIKADDPELPKVREAVNAANFNFGPTVVLTAPDNEGIIAFHSRYDIMLHPACPDNVLFVEAVLKTFFNAKEDIRRNFQQIKAKQEQAYKNRRPIGFKTNINSNE